MQVRIDMLVTVENMDVAMEIADEMLERYSQYGPAITMDREDEVAPGDGVVYDSNTFDKEDDGSESSDDTTADPSD